MSRSESAGRRPSANAQRVAALLMAEPGLTGSEIQARVGMTRFDWQNVMIELTYRGYFWEDGSHRTTRYYFDGWFRKSVRKSRDILKVLYGFDAEEFRAAIRGRSRRTIAHVEIPAA